MSIGTNCYLAAKRISKEWKQMAPPQKKIWENLAMDEKSEHQRKNPGYKYQPRRPDVIKRRAKRNLINTRESSVMTSLASASPGLWSPGEASSSLGNGTVGENPMVHANKLDGNGIASPYAFDNGLMPISGGYGAGDIESVDAIGWSNTGYRHDNNPQALQYPYRAEALTFSHSAASGGNTAEFNGGYDALGDSTFALDYNFRAPDLNPSSQDDADFQFMFGDDMWEGSGYPELRNE